MDELDVVFFGEVKTIHFQETAETGNTHTHTHTHTHRSNYFNDHNIWRQSLPESIQQHIYTSKIQPKYTHNKFMTNKIR